MDVKQIKHIGRKLKAFLRKSNDCFSRVEPRADLFAYVIDRLVHHSVVLELNVPSYRAEQARKRKNKHR